LDFLSLINFYLIPGLILGSIYALGAIGVTLVFAIMRHGHFAHGDLSTFGAFAVLVLVGATGLSPYVALPLAVVICGLVAVALDRIFYQHLRKLPKIITTISSLGVALMLRSVVQIFMGVNTLSYEQSISRATVWYGLRFKPHEIATIGVMLATVVGLEVFLHRSKWGKAMRAMSDNPDLSSLSGINNRHVVTLTWMIVGGLCAMSGFFLGLNYQIKAMMGWEILLPTFAAAILGGVGRVKGAIAGGLIIGVVEEFSVLVIRSEYKVLSAFIILVLVLLIRPTGLFRGKVL
jgi:branched-chain amino acid transport system permease protein/neutral amino acid transport system permease protein